MASPYPREGAAIQAGGGDSAARGPRLGRAEAIRPRACHDSAFMDGDGPRFGAMIALVAIVVAAVILVFFGIGYGLGRLFL
jgi:hypothetical protein